MRLLRFRLLLVEEEDQRVMHVSHEMRSQLLERGEVRFGLLLPDRHLERSLPL